MLNGLFPWKGKKDRKATPSEIEELLAYIRKRYDDYMVDFMKDERAKTMFEDRYYQTLKARIDLERFLRTEVMVVEELIDKEKKERNKKHELQRKAAIKRRQGANPKHNGADKILEDNNRRIKDYPEAGLGRAELYEIDKLYGTLIRFENDYWPIFETLLRKAYPSRHNSPRSGLEDQMFHLCRPNSEGYPPRLSRLVAAYNRFPRDYRDIEHEMQRSMIDAALFLNRVMTELDAMGQEEELKKLDSLEKVRKFVHTVIRDFRLRDLRSS